MEVHLTDFPSRSLKRGMQRTCFTQLKHIIGVHAWGLRLRVTQHTPTAATSTGQNGRSASTALMPARGSGAGCRYLTGAWLPMMELLPCMPLPPPPPRPIPNTTHSSHRRQPPQPSGGVPNCRRNSRDGCGPTPTGNHLVPRGHG